MKIKLHEGQYEVANDTHKYRVINAGRQWGKSVLSRLIVLQWALKTPGIYWVVSPTYRQGKQNHWLNLKKEIPREWIQNSNEVELSITLKNGSIIELKGAENPDSLRGAIINGLCVDEIASIHNWEWLWEEVLSATMVRHDAPAIFISTPKGFNAFYELFNKGQGNELNWKSWHFTSYNNPYLSKGVIDEKKKELTEDTFMQEYMADFRKHTGIAHKEWDREINFIEEFEIPSNWQRARGFDYGSVDFTASVRVVIDDEDNWFVDNCYLNNTSDVKSHAEAIRAQDYGFGFVPCWGDPTGKQWVEEFAMHEINIQDANKTVGQGYRGWVDYCISKVNERLKPQPGHKIYLPGGRVIENAPRLFVLKNGKTDKFVAQIERLSWKETITGEIVPILEDTGDPTGGHYDLMAAMRYFAVSYKKEEPDYIMPETDLSKKNWSLI